MSRLFSVLVLLMFLALPLVSAADDWNLVTLNPIGSILNNSYDLVALPNGDIIVTSTNDHVLVKITRSGDTLQATDYAGKRGISSTNINDCGGLTNDTRFYWPDALYFQHDDGSLFVGDYYGVRRIKDDYCVDWIYEYYGVAAMSVWSSTLWIIDHYWWSLLKIDLIDNSREWVSNDFDGLLADITTDQSGNVIVSFWGLDENYPYDSIFSGIAVLDSSGNTLEQYGVDNDPGYLDGDGDQAKFDCPNSIVAVGNEIYVADSRNYVIRRIVRKDATYPTGLVSTFSGHQNIHQKVDGSPGVASYQGLWSLSIDDSKNCLSFIVLDFNFSSSDPIPLIRALENDCQPLDSDSSSGQPSAFSSVHVSSHSSSSHVSSPISSPENSDKPSSDFDASSSQNGIGLDIILAGAGVVSFSVILLICLVLLILCCCLIFITPLFCWRRKSSNKQQLQDQQLQDQPPTQQMIQPVPPQVVVQQPQQQQNIELQNMNSTGSSMSVSQSQSSSVPLIINSTSSQNASVTLASQTPRMESTKSTSSLSQSGVSSSFRAAEIRIDTTCYEINPEEVVVQKKLGTGAYGIVYSAVWNSQEVAIKKLKDLDTLDEEESKAVLREFEKEVSLLAQLRHPNILTFYGAMLHFPQLAIVTEFCNNGSLHDQLYRKKAPISWKMTVSMAFDVSKAMAYLHKHNLIHRDLKPQNILLDDRWVAKVCDFGLSRVRESQDRHSMTQVVGSVLWMAPEVTLGNHNYGSACDVFSFGIILSELLTRQTPYSDREKEFQQQIHIKVALDPKLRPSIPENLPINLIEGEAEHSGLICQQQVQMIQLMNGCWGADPESRPKFEDNIVVKLGEMHKEIVGVIGAAK